MTAYATRQRLINIQAELNAIRTGYQSDAEFERELDAAANAVCAMKTMAERQHARDLQMTEQKLQCLRAAAF